MTEAEWLTSADPQAMLDFLRGSNPLRTVWQYPVPPPSERKLRLFACACCRQVWDGLTDPRSRRAVEVAERYANGLADDEERESAYEPAAMSERRNFQAGDFDSELAYKCCGPIEGLVANNGLPRWFSVSTKLVAAEQAALLRDIFGNLWRSMPGQKHVEDKQVCEKCGHIFQRFLPCGLHCPNCGTDFTRKYRELDAWLAWSNGTVPKIARAIYDERRFDELPILADALEEAGYEPPRGRTVAEVLETRRHAVSGGCCDRFADKQPCNCLLEDARPESLVEHLRSSAPHVRGCWVLDLILGKN